MPTRSEVRLYTLGIRLQQALIITRAVATQSASIVHGVMAQLVKAIDDLGEGTPFSASELQALQDLKKPCRVLQRQIVRSENDDFLDEAYDDFRRQSQLILRAFELAMDTLVADASRRWFQLGFVIVDGHDDEPEMSDEPDGFEDEIDDEDVDEEPSSTSGDDPVASSGELNWHWANSSFVHRLLESLGVSEDSVFPSEHIDLDQARWMEDLPAFVNSWDRVESGLQALTRNASETRPSDVRNEVASCGQAPSVQSSFRRPLPPSQQAILEVVRASGTRMTTAQIHAALEANGPTSLGMTKQALAEMMRAGMLDNGRDRRGRGYGLAE